MTEIPLAPPAPRAPASGAGVPKDTEFAQFRRFEFDGFEWAITSATYYPALGREGNLQKPKNRYFLIVEFEVKNISDKPRYYGGMKLLADGTQYGESSTGSVYAQYQTGYEAQGSTKFEPGSRLKSYVGFDVEHFRKLVLLISPWSGKDETRARVRLDSLTPGRS